MSIEAMKLALERIADPRNTHFAGDAQVVAREALAIAEAEKQEPVAIVVASQYEDGSYAGNHLEWRGRNEANDFAEGTAFYTHPQPKQEQGEPVAMRYDFDGYGYKYIDSGSGSDWQTRIKDAEPLYTTPYVPTGRQPVTDEQIEAKFKQCGGKWNGDQWVIEDADLHPFVRSIESPDLKTLQAVSDEYNAWIRHHAAGHTYDDFLAKREAAHGIKE